MGAPGTIRCPVRWNNKAIEIFKYDFADGDCISEISESVALSFSTIQTMTQSLTCKNTFMFDVLLPSSHAVSKISNVVELFKVYFRSSNASDNTPLTCKYLTWHNYMVYPKDGIIDNCEYIEMRCEKPIKFDFSACKAKVLILTDPHRVTGLDNMVNLKALKLSSFETPVAYRGSIPQVSELYMRSVPVPYRLITHDKLTMLTIHSINNFDLGILKSAYNLKNLTILACKNPYGLEHLTQIRQLSYEYDSAAKYRKDIKIVADACEKLERIGQLQTVYIGEDRTFSITGYKSTEVNSFNEFMTVISDSRFKY
jgi:hypothetical protein